MTVTKRAGSANAVTPRQSVAGSAAALALGAGSAVVALAARWLRHRRR